MVRTARDMLMLTLASALVCVADGLRLQPLACSRRVALSAGAAATIFPHSAFAADKGAAVFAQRFSISGNISPLPPLGQYSRYEDQLSTPKGSSALSLTVKFDFPQQLAQLGRSLGGIQFVDGNTGLKIYVLKAALPNALAEVPKKWIGDSLFSPDGTIAKEGVEIDAFKVTSAADEEAPEGAASKRRRFQLKYTVITPANQRATDRRGFADVYEVDGNAYILFASACVSRSRCAQRRLGCRFAPSLLMLSTVCSSPNTRLVGSRHVAVEPRSGRVAKRIVAREWQIHSTSQPPTEFEDASEKEVKHGSKREAPHAGCACPTVRRGAAKQHTRLDNSHPGPGESRGLARPHGRMLPQGVARAAGVCVSGLRSAPRSAPLGLVSAEQRVLHHTMKNDANEIPEDREHPSNRTHPHTHTSLARWISR
jgi:hypothetical protein